MLRVAILAEFPLTALNGGGAVGRGGGQGCTWLPQLALEFQEHHDLEIHWLVLDRTIRRTVVFEALGQWFHRVPSVKFSVDLALNYLPARFGLGREVRRIRPDVVHAWGAELAYPVALRDCHCPTIFSMQGSLTEYQRIGGLPDDWRWRKMVASEPGYVNTATVVTAESKWASERVRELKPDVDCRIVDYGVHPSFFEAKWSPDPNVPSAIYIGGGGYRKGIDVLLESLRRIPNRNWTMRFAGDAELGREVAAAGLPNTEFLGMLKWSDLLKEMTKSWCLVMPTRCDTGPTVVKEARVVGMPVIGTTHGGLRDYIRHGENGWIADPLNPSTLAAGLKCVMESHETACRMGLSHLGEDRAFFAPSLTAEKFAAIYHELASRANQAAAKKPQDSRETPTQ
ncbi:MAG: glycosyltransferase family 4 protein [Armatimonadetes bacterium]|nr:glycosyltransferase family 4 protein [Akkermansiaceae bacterium]